MKVAPVVCVACFRGPKSLVDVWAASGLLRYRKRGVLIRQIQTHRAQRTRGVCLQCSLQLVRRFL